MTTDKQRRIKAFFAERGLTPLQTMVLNTFTAGQAQDRVTIASHLDGGCSITKSGPLLSVADDVLKQLNHLGYTRQDAQGWHYLATTSPVTSGEAKS